MTGDLTTAFLDFAGMFLFLATELTLLFLIISYGVGLLQEHISPERIQAMLASRGGRGHVIAVALGAITPFCSCSTIPFLKGLLRARAGFGPMLVFLFASPLLNPVVLGLFAVSLGWQVTIFYAFMAIIVSLVAGITLEKLGFERFVEPSSWETPAQGSCDTGCTAPESKWKRVWRSTLADFRKALPYLMVGILIGSVIYGFLPADWLATYAGSDNLFAVPVSAVIGIPLYIRAEAVIAMSAALAGKGMSVGAIMALVIGSAGASLTEVILLRSIFRTPMIIAFLVTVLAMAVGTGYLQDLVLSG